MQQNGPSKWNGGGAVHSCTGRVWIEAQGSTMAWGGGREALRLIVIIRTRREIHE